MVTSVHPSRETKNLQVETYSSKTPREIRSLNKEGKNDFTIRREIFYDMVYKREREMGQGYRLRY
jgi:hypothetical protein